MPFTPTHVLAVLPINFVARNSLPLSALAIGAMTPDATMFFPLISPGYQVAHATYGPVLACLPVGMSAFLLFQFVMKEPLIGLCPPLIRNRLSATSKPNIKPSIVFFLLVSVAIIVGAYTHLLWDSFTHRHRWGTELIPALNKSYPVLGRKVTIFTMLQHGSSVIGLPILLGSALVWLKRQPIENNCLDPIFFASNFTRMLAVGLVFLILVQSAYQFALDQSLMLELRASQTATRSVFVSMLALIAYSVLIQVRSYRQILLNAREREIA